MVLSRIHKKLTTDCVTQATPSDRPAIDQRPTGDPKRPTSDPKRQTSDPGSNTMVSERQPVMHMDMMYGVAKYVKLNDMQKLMVLNKDFNKIAKSVVFSEPNESAIIDRHDNKLHAEMHRYGIKFIDIIKSSLRTTFFDDLSDLIEMQDVGAQINKLDLIFNYTIVCKKSINRYLPGIEEIQADRIDIQAPIFKITEKSHEEQDFKVFQFFLFITNKYMQGKARDVLKVSIIHQLMKYYDALYMSRLSAICSEESYKNLNRYSKTSRQSFQHVFIAKIVNDSVQYMDINLYNIYSTYMSNMLCKLYSKYLSASAVQDISNYDFIYTKSYHNYADDDLQVTTIRIILNLTSERTYFKSIKLHLLGMIFHYLTEIVANNIVSMCLLKTNKFFTIAKERCQSILEDLQDNNEYSQELKELVSSILIKNQEILGKNLPF